MGISFEEGVDGVLVLCSGFIVIEKHTIASSTCVFPIDGNLMTDPMNIAWINYPGKTRIYAVFCFVGLDGILRSFSDMSHENVQAYTEAFQVALGRPMDYLK